jgi:sugar phosphate isomerase/epimerase
VTPQVPALTASFVTLSGAGFAQPARIPFAQRCRAAASAGFTGIGLHSDDYRRMRAAGTTDDSLRALLAAHGLALQEIEFLSGWTTSGDDADASFRTLAEVFGPHHLTAGELTAGRCEIRAAGGRLRKICDDVSACGLRVAVESFPWSSLNDVATARAVVEASGASNAGLMIDVWHFYNSRSRLTDLDGLRPDQIVAVQLNDGRVVPDGFLAEARQRRLLPGEGELDLTGLLLGLHERGFRGPYCVEVNYPAYRELPVDDMATAAFTTAATALQSLPAG